MEGYENTVSHELVHAYVNRLTLRLTLVLSTCPLGSWRVLLLWMAQTPFHSTRSDGVKIYKPALTVRYTEYKRVFDDPRRRLGEKNW